MTVMSVRRKGSSDLGKSAAILPEGGFVLKLAAMPFADRVRTAWDCRECRFYRRTALALGLLAACSWYLL
jgi:hypothetical protein